MIDRKDVMPIAYYKSETFTGSYRGMRYLIRKKETEEGKLLEAVTWPQPFSYEVTADDKKTANTFTYDEAGICAAVDWLNASYEERKEDYDAASRSTGLAETAL